MDGVGDTATVHLYDQTAFHRSDDIHLVNLDGSGPICLGDDLAGGAARR